jgi:SAM-dependent methyltransferase
MRFYCEYHSETINHTSPSVRMLDYILQLEKSNNQIGSILDLGCGNGRNSLYLAKRYNSTNVVLVDFDSSMLDWAQRLFFHEELPAKTVCARVEDLGAMAQSKFEEVIGSSCFDIIVFSYVLQHIDPVYYPLIFDLCKRITRKYLAIDVFWNPTRVSPGESTTSGSVNWYGLTHEELAGVVAPRFRILGDRVHRNSISIMVNMLLTEGQTPVESITEFDLGYYSGRIKGQRKRASSRLGFARKGTRNLISIDIHELECIRLLASLYPAEMDFVNAELVQWTQNYENKINPSLMAAKLLWLCRANKVPIMLKELSNDFHIRAKDIIQALSETNYIPPLTALDYIDRISRQVSLPDSIRDRALSLVQRDMTIDNTTPGMRACCSVIRAAEEEEFGVARFKVASILGVTTAGINMALKRAETI